jgi:hypothetical protein
MHGRALGMNEYVFNLQLREISSTLKEVKNDVELLKKENRPELGLWDNSDIIRNWKTSERTLATWRKKGLISYVQLSGKIWYTKESREEFLRRNLIQNKNV